MINSFKQHPAFKILRSYYCCSKYGTMAESIFSLKQYQYSAKIQFKQKTQHKKHFLWFYIKIKRLPWDYFSNDDVKSLNPQNMLHNAHQMAKYHLVWTKLNGLRTNFSNRLLYVMYDLMIDLHYLSSKRLKHLQDFLQLRMWSVLVKNCQIIIFYFRLYRPGREITFFCKRCN